MNTAVDVLDYQWDLSSIDGTITGYTIHWQVATHSISYGDDVTKSTATNSADVLQAASEPATWAMCGLGLTVLLFDGAGKEHSKHHFRPIFPLIQERPAETAFSLLAIVLPKEIAIPSKSIASRR